LFQFGGQVPHAIKSGAYWRLITAGFLHSGAAHFASNMVLLYFIGPRVKRVYGSSRFLVIYLAATIMGYLASTWYGWSLSVGASAGIIGLVGALCIYAFSGRTTEKVEMRKISAGIIVLTAVQAILPIVSNNAAHFGGFLGGGLVAYIAGVPTLTSRWKERAWASTAWSLTALTVFSFLKLYLGYPFPPFDPLQSFLSRPSFLIESNPMVYSRFTKPAAKILGAA